MRIGSRCMWRNGFQRKLVGGAAQSLAKIIVACAIITGAMNGTTLACPKDNDSMASPVVAIRQNAVEIITSIVSAGAIKANGAPNSTDGRCSGGCQCKIFGCGCCLASLASLNPVSACLFLAATSIQLSPLDQSEAASARPPPDFRPPRTFI